MLFDIYKQKVKLMLNADEVHIIIVEPSLLEVFQSEDKGYTQPVKIENKTYFRVLENRKGVNKRNKNNREEYFNDSIITSFEQVFKGVKNKFEICLPIKKIIQGPKTFGAQNKFPMHCIVQVERIKTFDHTPKHFSIVEGHILENMTHVLSSAVTRIHYCFAQNKRVNRAMDMLKTFREITMERNHAKIFNKIMEYVPSLLNVEKVGAFFVDTGNSDYMYTITDSKISSDGIPYITEIAKYPTELGLTGKAMITKEIISYEKDKEMEVLTDPSPGTPASINFVGELDNHPCAPNVR